VEAVKSLETALGKVAAQLYASDDRTGSTLGRIAERLDRAETETTTAVRRLETSFAGLDDRLRGVENRAPAAAGVSDQRFEQLAGQLSARMEASRAEMAQMLERAAANRFAQLDRVVDGLTGHVEAAERRSHQAIEKLGHEVLRVADVLGKRMVQVENRSADAVEQVGGEVVRVAAAMEARLGSATTPMPRRWSGWARRSPGSPNAWLSASPPPSAAPPRPSTMWATRSSAPRTRSVRGTTALPMTWPNASAPARSAPRASSTRPALVSTPSSATAAAA
jgi:hypothetical protein